MKRAFFTDLYESGADLTSNDRRLTSMKTLKSCKYPFLSYV